MILLYIIAVLQLLSFTGASESGIVGGKESKPHSRRYMVELQCRGRHVCGGILIRKDFVLTSAHCKKDCDDMMVVLGAHNITKDEKSQQNISVAGYLPHPKYYDGKFKNDIMLLKLKSNAKLNKNVKTIGLPKWNEKIHANTKCLVAGWGRTDPSANSPPSDVLRETTVKMQAGAECKKKWTDYFSNDQMICTHTDGKKAGICQGDSGGPLICAGKLHGISAFTLDGGCDDPFYPHVFIKVPFFSQWIKTEMNGDDIRPWKRLTECYHRAIQHTVNDNKND